MFPFASRRSLLLTLVVLVAPMGRGDVFVQAADVEPGADHGSGHVDDHGTEHADGHDPAGHGEEGHDAGDHGGIDYNKPPLEVDVRLLAWSLVVFLAFLWLAKRLAWLPLIEGLDARESRVNRALADAETARLEATRLLADHKKQLDHVTEEVKSIIAKSRTEAEQEKARIISEAEVEAVSLRDRAIAEIHAAREEALEGLDGQIENQVDLAARHVLG